MNRLNDGPVSVTCNFLADDVIGLPYFCATLHANPENPFEVFSDNFLFDLTGDLTQGAGNYNFCTYITVGATEDLESQVESCLIELIIAPDGDTLVEIDRSGLNASAFASRGGLLHSGLDNFADTVNYKIVNDQASGSVSIDQQAPDHVVDALVSKVRSQLGQ